MPQIKVKVKWDRQLFSDIDLNTDHSPGVFKKHLFKLTGVPPDRQKLLVKGIVVKDSWDDKALSPNCLLLLLGSKDALPMEPIAKTVFLEDMTESEISKASNLPPGLNNLGNTCYINATIQCLKTVPELRAALKNFEGTFTYNKMSKDNFVISLRDQYDLMDKGLTSPPLGILHSLHGILPKFAEKESTGTWRQQDADEFWLEVINILQETLPAYCNETEKVVFKSIIDQYFAGTFEVEYVCLDSESEPLIKNEEQFYQLSCFITSDVKYLQLGLKSKLIEMVTKHSVTLNQDAQFKKNCKICRLPAYLTIQFVRFYYKEKENINAKILRDVKFPIYFDAYDLCTLDLQKRLVSMREKIKEADDRGKGNKNEANVCELSCSFENDIGSNNSGFYQLYAVLTHQGRSSDKGHYVAWINHQGMWIKCDDSEISIVTEESILKLSGGGDWHTAYILLYGPRIFKENNPISSNLAESTST